MEGTQLLFIFGFLVTLGFVAEGCSPVPTEDPVCGSNGVTYNNEGYWWCLTQWPKMMNPNHTEPEVTIVHKGPCADKETKPTETSIEGSTVNQ